MFTMGINFLNMKQTELGFLLNYLYVISRLYCSPDARLRIWYYQWR